MTESKSEKDENDFILSEVDGLPGFWLAPDRHPDQTEPTQNDIGVTSDLRARLRKHNQGDSAHTSKFWPWSIVSYHSFASKETALAFEKYLMSGSGKAFAQRHLGESGQFVRSTIRFLDPT